MQNVLQILEEIPGVQRSKGSDTSTVGEAVNMDGITDEDLDDLCSCSIASQASIETTSIHTQVEQNTSDRGIFYCSCRSCNKVSFPI